jgi:hypothetical protein
MAQLTLIWQLNRSVDNNDVGRQNLNRGCGRSRNRCVFSGTAKAASKMYLNSKLHHYYLSTAQLSAFIHISHPFHVFIYWALKEYVQGRSKPAMDLCQMYITGQSDTTTVSTKCHRRISYCSTSSGRQQSSRCCTR